jgi:hypothetical protein
MWWLQFVRPEFQGHNIDDFVGYAKILNANVIHNMKASISIHLLYLYRSIPLSKKKTGA